MKMVRFKANGNEIVSICWSFEEKHALGENGENVRFLCSFAVCVRWYVLWTGYSTRKTREHTIYIYDDAYWDIRQTNNKMLLFTIFFFRYI